MTCGLVLVERVGRLVSLHKIANNLFKVQVPLPWTPEGGGRLEGNYKGRGRVILPHLTRGPLVSSKVLSFTLLVRACLAIMTCSEVYLNFFYNKPLHPLLLKYN